MSPADGDVMPHKLRERLNEMGPEALAERVAATAAGASVGLSVTASIATINEFLQAGAYVVAIVSGVAATVYYIRKSGK